MNTALRAIDRPSIAILVKRFPKLSETFILKEILDLEARGWSLRIFTLAEPSDTVVHHDVANVRATIEQLPEHDPATALASRLRALGITHVHAHFADAPASIARAAAAEIGIGYSVSAHAKDIYRCEPRLLARNLRDARFVVTCTGHNAKTLRAIAPGVPIAKLYHGIDCERLLPGDQYLGKLPGAQERPLILSIGRLRAKKGFDTLISACAVLQAKGVDFRCAIVGYGPEQHALETQISAAQLQDTIQLLGKLPHEAVIALFRQARVFALPCRIDADGDRDGIPNVILEAMALGIPVVSTCVSGVPEAVSDGECGLLVPPDDPHALAHAIERLLTDAALARALIISARKTIEQRFTGCSSIDMLDRLLLAASGADNVGVAYVLKGFPRLSESFIANEILQLESSGSLLTLFALKHGDALAAPVLDELRSPLAYLPEVTSVSGTPVLRWLRDNFPAHAAEHGRVFKRRPLAYLKTLFRALVFSRRYRTGGSGPIRRAFIKEFVQAGTIADQLLLRGIRHVHGHFCHGATTVTWMAADLAGARFSFTAHAKDIYQPELNPRDLLERKIAAASFVATCTHANRDLLIQRRTSQTNVHTIYHGLDTAFFAPAQNMALDPPMILAVGRHVRKKGFDLLIAACAELQQRGLRFQCRIVGESGDESEALRHAIHDANLDDIVTLSPALPRAALRDLYREAAVFVLPCRIDDNGDRDGIPNVLAEAMATELAVISTRISGIPEVVNDGENGLLVAPDDVEGLTSAIAHLLEDSALRAKLGRAARNTICEVFDAATTTKQLQSLLERAA